MFRYCRVIGPRPRNRAIFQGPARPIVAQDLLRPARPKLFFVSARPGPPSQFTGPPGPARPGLNTDYRCTFKNDIHIIEFYDNAQTVIQSGKILTFKMIMIIIKTYKSNREVM